MVTSNTFCHCGCGKEAPIITKNNKKRGYVLGERHKFIKGHHLKTWPGYQQEDRGYDTPCWIWLGYVDKTGYAWHSGTHVPRLTWTREFGVPFPEGLEPDHLCRVRSCVNPYHIEPVTRLENIKRAVRQRKTHCPQDHPYDENNSYIDSRGFTHCVTCRRHRSLAHYHKTKRLKEMQAGG